MNTDTEPRQWTGTERRIPWDQCPDETRSGWLCVDDDELLARIEDAPLGPETDDALLAVVASERHFFVRQAAALRVSDPDRLRPFADDRHVGQILARRLNRAEDVEYLRRLIDGCRHVEVRRAAKAQLEDLLARLGSEARSPSAAESVAAQLADLTRRFTGLS